MAKKNPTSVKNGPITQLSHFEQLYTSTTIGSNSLGSRTWFLYTFLFRYIFLFLIHNVQLKRTYRGTYIYVNKNHIIHKEFYPILHFTHLSAQYWLLTSIGKKCDMTFHQAVEKWLGPSPTDLDDKWMAKVKRSFLKSKSYMNSSYKDQKWF